LSGQRFVVLARDALATLAMALRAFLAVDLRAGMLGSCFIRNDRNAEQRQTRCGKHWQPSGRREIRTHAFFEHNGAIVRCNRFLEENPADFGASAGARFKRFTSGLPR
jgi:hypothetical protein